ncbi:DNA topoisomerase 1-like [Motacilla alba alba]|uniref:DNA topoisomerase 1-like n=1 Tax=Motacilla alba alba TaxID=1094192 RepID=UPI0018D54855|nr:DNA topoisomerase 1-like [Motacilla alba alba]
MGVSKASEVKSSSRKRKNELEKGQDKPKELECTVKPSTVKGKKKKPSKAREKPLQENVISSSLKQEAVDGKGLGSSLWNGIQAKEGAAPGLEETKATSPQGPAVGLEGSSRFQDKSQRTGPAVGEQHLETQNGIRIWDDPGRWEEEKKEDGVKWMQLEHRGPYFVPPYEPLPKDVQFYYDAAFWV